MIRRNEKVSLKLTQQLSGIRSLLNDSIERLDHN